VIHQDTAPVEDAQYLLSDKSQEARSVTDIDTLLATDILTSDDEHVMGDMSRSSRTTLINCAVDVNCDVTPSFSGISFRPSMINGGVFATLYDKEDNMVSHNRSTSSNEDVDLIDYLFDHNDEDDQLLVQDSSACHGFDHRGTKKVRIFRRVDQLPALLTSAHLTYKATYQEEFSGYQESSAQQIDGLPSDGDTDLLSNFSDDSSGQPILDACEEWDELLRHASDLRELSKVDFLYNGTNKTFLGSDYRNTSRINEFDPSRDEILNIGF
jgi:hypothetical protein